MGWTEEVAIEIGGLISKDDLKSSAGLIWVAMSLLETSRDIFLAELSTPLEFRATFKCLAVRIGNFEGLENS